MELRGVSRTPDQQPRTGIGFRPARTTFVALRAHSCVTFPPTEAGGRPSIRLRPPTEDTPRKPRIAATRSPGHKGRLREPRQVLPLVDFGHPTAHASTVSRVHASGSLRRHSPRAGFGYPLRGYSPRLPTRQVVSERPWASLSKGFPSSAIGPPFGGRTLLTLPRTRPSPRRRKVGTEAAFRVLLPRRVRTAPRFTEHESRVISAVDPFLRFVPFRVLLPLDLAHAFNRRASPRTLGRGDVPVRPGLRVSGIKRVGHPVSGAPTLLGFVTLRICGAPSASLKGSDHRRSARSSDPALLPSHLDPIFSNATRPPKWPPPLSRSILSPSAGTLLRRHPRSGITPHDRESQPTVAPSPLELSSRAAPRGAGPL